jgi:hypothetical protein
MVNRSGYVDYLEEPAHTLYRGRVANTIRGKRSQAFLRELLAALDVMPRKRLIKDALIDENGEPCAIGVVCQTRDLDVSQVNYEDPDQVGRLVGVSKTLAAELEFENDDGVMPGETPGHRWQRIRNWVQRHLK